MDFGVTWRTVAVSVVGTSHLDQKLPCQDECFAESCDKAGSQWLIVVAADGAGSALAGEVGARLCVEAVVRAAHEICDNADSHPAEADARRLFAIARTAVLAHAETTSIAPRELSSTLLCGLFREQVGVVFQIGDGALVLDGRDGLWLPIAPMNGEYANSTRFVTDDDAPEQLGVAVIDAPITRVAAFTDGIQSIAVHRATGNAHAPFFEPLFETLIRAPLDDDDALAHGLRAFLSSERVNQRTDDDKTLALAVWRG
jgi:hypothetical protein